MAEIRERRTVIEDIPIARRPVVENQYEHIVHERRGMSGGAVAAIVIGAIIAAVLITMMIVSSQDQSREDELAIERQRAAAAERSAAQAQAAQQQPQQPQVVVVPGSQPSTVPVPVPVPVPAQPSTAATDAATSAIGVEIDVTSKLLDDAQLRQHPVTVKLENGAARLSGTVPSEELKARAEKIAMSVKGVRRVINEITVQP